MAKEKTKKEKTKKEKAKKEKVASEKRTSQSPSNDTYRNETETITDDEQPKENVMAPPYGEGSPSHQSADQELEFQKVLQDLCDTTEKGANFRKHVVEFPKTLEGYNLSPEQQLALIAVGHASGKYTFKPGHGYCCCCG